eukprot:846484-Alexandrium_andersonii.AAC.1
MWPQRVMRVGAAWALRRSHPWQKLGWREPLALDRPVRDCSESANAGPRGGRLRGRQGGGAGG